MPSAKAERAMTLVARIGQVRAELSELENEFEELISPAKGKRELNGHAAPKRRIARRPVKKGRQHNRDRVFLAIQRAKGPIKLLALRKKLKLSESCLFTNVQALVKDKKIGKVGHGTYEAKS